MVQPADAAKEISRLSREMERLYHELSLKTGLSDSAFLIFYAIGELGDGCLQTQIADEYCVSRQTINTSVKRLVQQGFLSLAPGRGRGMHLHLTPAGRAVMEQKLAPVFALEDSVLASMPAAQRAQLLRLLGRYVQLYRRHVRAPG